MSIDSKMDPVFDFVDRYMNFFASQLKLLSGNSIITSGENCIEIFSKLISLSEHFKISDKLDGFRRKICFNIKKKFELMTKKYLDALGKCKKVELEGDFFVSFIEEIAKREEDVVKQMEQIFKSKINFDVLVKNIAEIGDYIYVNGENYDTPEGTIILNKKYNMIRRINNLPEEIAKEIRADIAHKTLLDKIYEYIEYMKMINKFPSSKSDNSEEKKFAEFRRTQKKTFNSRKKKLTEDEISKLELIFKSKKVKDLEKFYNVDDFFK